jgi:hypothetical protein
MSMPKFTAETSLYKIHRHYRTHGVAGQADRGIQPALIRKNCYWNCMASCDDDPYYCSVNCDCFCKGGPPRCYYQ